MLPRRWVGFVVLIVLLAGLLPWARAAEKAAVQERMTRDITFLASDECEGRGVNTKGIELAADHIAEQFKKAGLKPAGVDGTFFQPFTMPASSAGVKAELRGPSSLLLHGPLGLEIELPIGKDFQVAGLSGSGVITGPVVFVGYGATAEKSGYDDYKGVDVAGKVVMILRKVPRAENNEAPFEGGVRGPNAGLSVKAKNAEKHKAAAILFVNDASTRARDGDRLMDFDYTATDEGVNIPAFQIRRDVADRMLQSGLGKGLTDLEKDIDRTLQPASAELTGWKASVQTSVFRAKLSVKNVVGVLEGAGPLANETVVIGAHYDHLGYMHPGSLLRDKSKPQIHHGADDNASGTTTLRELARRFGAMENRQGRRLVFVAFTGEESGLYGSAHYVANPVVPLKETVAMVNLDMVGRLSQDKTTGKDKLLVEGSGTAKTFDALLESWAKKYDFKLSKEPSGFGPSDHASFYGKSVPVIFYWTGNHPDYHKPSDTADKINVEGMMKITDLAEETVAYLAEVKERPEYVEIKPKFSPGMMAGVPRIGIQPAYGEDGDGVLLDGVSEGGPAAKAGLKAGDRILEVAGKPFQGMQGYTPLMAGRPKGQPVEFTVLRDGKKITVTVIPE